MLRLQAENFFADSRLIEKGFLAERVLLEESLQFGVELLRLFFRDEMAAGKRAAAHVASHLAPIGDAIKQRRDHALPAPEGEQRHGDSPSPVLLVVHEVDRRRGSVILAGGMDRPAILERAHVLGDRAPIEVLELRRPAAETAED